MIEPSQSVCHGILSGEFARWRLLGKSDDDGAWTL
jgi:hypothetical protein